MTFGRWMLLGFIVFLVLDIIKQIQIKCKGKSSDVGMDETNFR